MQPQDNKNLLLAIALSVIVMVGWQYYFGAPQLQQQRQQAQQTQGAQPGGAPAVPGAPATQGGQPAPGATNLPAVTVSRAAALERSPRIAVETPALKGSIALVGGRIDDLSLANYRETVVKNSANIELFTPPGAANAYFADFGWVPAAGQSAQVPGAETRWTADAMTLKPGSPVTLTWDNGQGLAFTRRIEVDERYLFTVTDSVRNTGSSPVSLSNYGRVTLHGTPKTLGYAVLHEGPIGYAGEKLQEPSYDSLRKARTQTFQNNTGGWLGFTEKYWAAVVLPSQQKPFSAAFTATGEQPVYEAAAIGEAVTVAPGAAAEASMRLFAGAKEVHTVDGYAKSAGIAKFDLLIDWGWFYWLTKPMFFLIDFLFKLVGNFGVVILLVTVLIKAAFFPLANKSYESMARMKAVQPEMLAIRDRFADDKVKQQQAMMELYKKEKINPLAGCLPVLIQIPVFFALYKVLLITIEMRHAPFFGWIKDLAAPDPTTIFNLFGLLPFDPTTLPYFGPFLHLGIWPLIMGVTMWLQMKMNPEPTDPVQKTVFAWMPVIFTFMLAAFPAGLVIYWTWNNLLSVAQQYAIMKRMGTKIELWDNIRGMFRKA